MRPDDANALGERRAAMFTQTIPANITHIAAPEAWTYSTGVGARVLFIDKGYDRGHEDLPVVPLGNCSNGSRNGCDDDPVFNQNHGTAVAGVTFARNNTFGVVGVAHGVSASDAYFWGACDTSCYDQDIIGGLNWAISSLGSLGIINMSLSGNIWQQAIADCVSAANAAGHVQVASAGNSGITEIRYPAGYPDVFGVGGVKPDDVHHPVSTTGTQVDFVAPYTVYTTSPGNTYTTRFGNSWSTPAVTGLVALLRSRYPAWDRSAVFSKIKMTALELGTPGWDNKYGFGRIRANLAVAFECPSTTATVVGGKPKMSWSPVPYAVSYRIYRRVTPDLAPNWVLWDSTTSTNYTDYATKVLSFYGYETLPPYPQVAVSYYVAAWTGDVECGLNVSMAYLPNGIPPL
jgi:serine protease